MAYGPGTANPLIDSTGKSRVGCSPGTTVTPGALVAVSGGESSGHRHARVRRSGFRAARRLSVKVELSGALAAVACDAVNEAFSVTCGGAVGTAWWPPDESGTAEAAPRWLFVETPTFERSGSGQGVVIGMELLESV